MGLISLLMSLLIFLQYTHFPQAASASQVNVNTTASGDGSTIDGAVPVNKIGKLLLPDGMAILKGNVIDVEGTPKGQTDKKTQLSGVVVKTTAKTSGSTCKMSGIAYFRSGPSLSALGDSEAEELIDLTDGGVVQGRIVAINRDELEIQDKNGNRRRFAMGLIAAIHSPFAFAFTISLAAGAAVALGSSFAAEVPKISFTGTGGGHPVAVKPQQQTSSTGEGPAIGKIMIITGVMLGVAAAIAVPIAVGVALHNNNNSDHDAFVRNIQARDFAEFLKRQQQPSQPVTPPPVSP